MATDIAGGRSIQYRSMFAIARIIKSLALEGFPIANVYPRKRPFAPGAVHPGCFLFPVPEVPLLTYGDSHMLIGYGTQVSFTQASNQKTDEWMDRIFHWRQETIMWFQGSPHPFRGISDVYETVIEPGPVLDEFAFRNQYDVTAFIIRANARVRRTKARGE